MPQSSERRDGWYSIARGELPNEGEMVGVHGGVAQYRDGWFFTGMEDPRWERAIRWPVTHWLRLNPPNEREPEPARAEPLATVRIGTSSLTRDLVWCECGRGLNLLGKWTYCPNCGKEISQDSYRAAVEEASRNGANLYRNADADRAILAVEKALRIASGMSHRKTCSASRLEVDDRRCTCGLYELNVILRSAE